MNSLDLFGSIDSRITSHQDATAEGIAGELRVTVQDIESAVREIDGVSFDEYRESKRLAHALRALEEERAPAGSKIHQEERAQPRLAVAGATVRYLLMGNDICKSEFSNPYPIVDLSTAGIAFLADRPAKPGRKVCLLASFPKEKDPFRLEGHVIYSVAVDTADHRYRLGIRFQDFAAKEGCNRPEVLEGLVRAIKPAAS